MENRMYVNALRVYQKLLEHGGKEITGEMRERILHNQGCAYGYLFQMDKALDCFWKAWKENHSEKAMKVYLLAYRSVHSEEEYRKRQEELKTDERVMQETDQALKNFAGLPEQHIVSGETDRILEILQENITEVPALKAVQEVPAGSAGLLFCIYGFFLRQRTEVIIQGLSDTGLFQIDTEKSIFFGKKAEKNGIVR